MQDLRYAFRTLRNQPIFTLVAILTLTLGIGANTAIFSVIYQTLLRPLLYADVGRLVVIWNSYHGINLDKASVSIPDSVDRRTQAPAIEDATLFTQRTANLNEGGNPEQMMSLAVTPSFFSTLGVRPFIGRPFAEEEAKPDADKFVVLTYALWRSHYGADPAIVGRDIRVNADAYRVVGVLPAGFEIPGQNIALLVPFAFTAAQMSDQGRGNEFSQMIARDPGFSSENVLTAQIALPRTRYPDAAAITSFWGRAIDRARAIPGVTEAGLTTNVRFNGNVSSGSYSIVGRRPRAPGEPSPHGRQEIVGGDDFKAMRIPLVAGRLFNDGDTPTSPPVVVVDEYLVKKYFADRSPLGQQIQRGGPASPKYTIVGVVGTINSVDLGQPDTKERLYYPVTQVAARSMAVILKTGLDPQSLVGQVRAAIRGVDPEQPIADVRTMEEWIGRSLQTAARRRRCWRCSAAWRSSSPRSASTECSRSA